MAESTDEPGRTDTMVVDCNVRLAFNSSEPFDLAQGERPRNSVRGELSNHERLTPFNYYVVATEMYYVTDSGQR